MECGQDETDNLAPNEVKNRIAKTESGRVSKHRLAIVSFHIMMAKGPDS